MAFTDLHTIGEMFEALSVPEVWSGFSPARLAKGGCGVPRYKIVTLSNGRVRKVLRSESDHVG